ncbi:MAG: hypothetical protein ACYS0E_14765 [Planctomycetota bacterium]
MAYDWTGSAPARSDEIENYLAETDGEMTADANRNIADLNVADSEIGAKNYSAPLSQSGASPPVPTVLPSCSHSSSRSS